MAVNDIRGIHDTSPTSKSNPDSLPVAFDLLDRAAIKIPVACRGCATRRKVGFSSHVLRCAGVWESRQQFWTGAMSFSKVTFSDLRPEVFGQVFRAKWQQRLDSEDQSTHKDRRIIHFLSRCGPEIAIPGSTRFCSTRLMNSDDRTTAKCP